MARANIGAERRRSLMDAVIAAIHDRGSLDITMRQIADRAGVSTALAHHYFGAKDRLVLATMHHLLSELNLDLQEATRQAETPRARLSAILATNFGETQFRPATASAWLAFYVLAQESAEGKRLLRIYTRRLESNLIHALYPLLENPLLEDTTRPARPAAVRQAAKRIAQEVGALIDGFYLRRALGSISLSRTETIAQSERLLDRAIAAERHALHSPQT